VADIALKAVPSYQVAPNEIDVVLTDDFVSDTQRAGVDLTAGQAVRYDPATGDWLLADATATAANNRVYGIVTRTAKAGEYVTAIQKGLLDGFDLSALSYGVSVFLSNTSGAIADAAGTTTLVLGKVVPVRSQTRGLPADKLFKVDINFGTPLAA